MPFPWQPDGDTWNSDTTNWNTDLNFIGVKVGLGVQANVQVRYSVRQIFRVQLGATAKVQATYVPVGISRVRVGLSGLRLRTTFRSAESRIRMGSTGDRVRITYRTAPFGIVLEFKGVAGFATLLYTFENLAVGFSGNATQHSNVGAGVRLKVGTGVGVLGNWKVDAEAGVGLGQEASVQYNGQVWSGQMVVGLGLMGKRRFPWDTDLMPADDIWRVIYEQSTGNWAPVRSDADEAEWDVVPGPVTEGSL